MILDDNGIGPEYYDGKGVKRQMTKDLVYNGEFLTPFKGSDPLKYERLLDFDKVSYNYPSAKEFLEDRLDKNNVLHLDGIMYIQKGDIDFTRNEDHEEIATFTGRGLIYLAEGNVTFGSVFDKEDLWKDWCEFYLRDGDFILAPSSINVVRASLIALSNDYTKSQGSLILNNDKEVGVWGNLVFPNSPLLWVKLRIHEAKNLYDNDKIGKALEITTTISSAFINSSLKNKYWRYAIGHQCE